MLRKLKCSDICCMSFLCIFIVSFVTVSCAPAYDEGEDWYHTFYIDNKTDQEFLIRMKFPAGRSFSAVDIGADNIGAPAFDVDFYTCDPIDYDDYPSDVHVQLDDLNADIDNAEFGNAQYGNGGWIDIEVSDPGGTAVYYTVSVYFPVGLSYLDEDVENGDHPTYYTEDITSGYEFRWFFCGSFCSWLVVE
jgi:hypothetical protein